MATPQRMDLKCPLNVCVVFSATFILCTPTGTSSHIMPLVPLGCAVQIHEKPSKRRTWAVHSVDGWYLGTSPGHYRCYDVWVKGTGAVRSTNTVFFKHKHITNPTVTPADAIVNAAKDLTAALKGNVPGSLGATSLDDLKNWKKYLHKRQRATNH